MLGAPSVHISNDGCNILAAAPYKGLGADSEEKHEPVSDIDTTAVDSLKALDPERPIREADIAGPRVECLRWGKERTNGLFYESAPQARRGQVVGQTIDD